MALETNLETRGWPPRCTTAAVDIKSTPQWSVISTIFDLQGGFQVMQSTALSPRVVGFKEILRLRCKMERI